MLNENENENEEMRRRPIRKARRSDISQPGDIVACIFCGGKFPYIQLAANLHRCEGGDIAAQGRMAPLTPEAIAKSEAVYEKFMQRPVDLNAEDNSHDQDQQD